MPGRNETTTLVAIAATIVVVDQWTKAAIVSALGPMAFSSRLELGAEWLALEYAENRGAAFGVFPDLTQGLILVSVAIVMGLMVHYARDAGPPAWRTVGIAAIAGGAIGNLLDRIRLGYVVDFISVGDWPNFNVADSAITVGALLVVWGWLQANGDSARPELG